MKETAYEETERLLRDNFDALKPSLKKWGEIVDGKIIEALKSETTFDYKYHVKMFPVFRVKDTDSFIKKALYRKSSGKIYTDPLREIEDKVGTRLVVLTSNHMMQVKNILLSKSEFWDCSIGRDKALIKESIKEFDYEAIHLIVKPLETEEAFEGQNLAYLSCEIQIKTLFQHAYSEMSHDTVYKGPYRHDLSLLRKLARSMALLESTDENFNSMYNYINSGEGLAINFLKDLIIQYKKIQPDFDEKQANLDIDSYVLDELMAKNALLKLDMENISAFVDSEVRALTRINEKPNFLLGRQPIMLLLSYLIKLSPESLYDLDFDISLLQSLAFMVNANFNPPA